MGAKYSYGVWEQFADQANIILRKTESTFVWVSKLWQAPLVSMPQFIGHGFDAVKKA